MSFTTMNRARWPATGNRKHSQHRLGQIPCLALHQPVVAHLLEDARHEERQPRDGKEREEGEGNREGIGFDKGAQPEQMFHRRSSSASCLKKANISENYFFLSVTNDMSGFIAHDLSGLIRSPKEVTDEADRVVRGEPEDAI